MIHFIDCNPFGDFTFWSFLVTPNWCFFVHTLAQSWHILHWILNQTRTRAPCKACTTVETQLLSCRRSWCHWFKPSSFKSTNIPQYSANMWHSTTIHNSNNKVLYSSIYIVQFGCNLHKSVTVHCGKDPFHLLNTEKKNCPKHLDPIRRTFTNLHPINTVLWYRTHY